MESKPICGMLLCLTVIQSLIYCISAQGVDLTRVPEANGAGVVLAATAIIQSSGIFENDNGLLRRIAYVQSKDGTDDDTFGPESFGGIWQLNRNAFKTTQNESLDILRPKHQSIRECLGIDWPQVNSSDLHKALHSALAARLFLSIIDEPIPTSIEDQARYWQQHYCDTFRSNCTVERFIQDVLANERQERCETRGLDLMFLLDSSGSIGESNFELVRQFVLDVSRIFRIGPRNTQIGVIIFSDSSQVIFNLNRHQDRQSLERAIRRIPYLAGATDTAEGLRDLLNGFSAASGVRLLSEAVPRVAIVLTDGHSDIPTLTERAALAVLAAGIQVYAVGVGENFNMEELQTIASHPDERFIHSAATFGTREFQTLRRELRATACGLGTNVTVGDPPVVTTVAQGERINLNLRCPENGTTLQLCVQNGTSILYASDDIENPGEAFFDYRLIVGNGSCDSVFALCRDFCSSQNPNRNPDDVGDLDNTIHITIQGSDENNTVSIQTTDGDTTTPTEPSPTEPPTTGMGLQLSFVNGSPRVNGSSAVVEFRASGPISSIVCYLREADGEGNEIENDCNSRKIEYHGLSPTKYIVRVVARSSDRDRIIVRRGFTVEPSTEPSPEPTTESPPEPSTQPPPEPSTQPPPEPSTQPPPEPSTQPPPEPTTQPSPAPEPTTGGSLQLFFINASPRVSGSSAVVEFMASGPISSIVCYLRKADEEEGEIESDCDSGEIEYNNLTPGKYTVRVVARATERGRRRVVRRSFLIGDTELQCTVNLINDGIAVEGSSVTIQFRGSPVDSYQCSLDDEEPFPCSSPLMFEGLSAEEHRFEVVPVGCGDNFRSYSGKFTVDTA